MNCQNETDKSTSVPGSAEQVDAFSTEDGEESGKEEIIEYEEKSEDVPEPIKYHRDKKINEIITKYNELAEVQVSPESVQNITHTSQPDTYARLQ